MSPYYRLTPAATDRKVKAYLDKRLRDDDRPWDVLGGENCRVFSQSVYDHIVSTFGGATPVVGNAPKKFMPYRVAK